MIVNELAESGFQRKAAEGDGPRTSGFHHECHEAARVSPDVRFRIEAAPGEAPSRSISQSKVPVAASVPTESKFQTEEISKVSICLQSLWCCSAEERFTRIQEAKRINLFGVSKRSFTERETRPGLHSGTQQPRGDVNSHESESSVEADEETHLQAWKKTCRMRPTRESLHQVYRLQKRHLYMGRGASHQGLSRSIWCNPFSVRRFGLDEALSRFERFVRHRPALMDRVSELEDRILLCHCKTGAKCHADILIKLWDERFLKQSEDEGAPSSRTEKLDSG